MLLRGVLQALGCQRLQRTDDAEARVARFDHVVDIAVASGVVGIRELVVVLLLLLGHEPGFLFGRLDRCDLYRNAAGGEELRDTLCRESVTYTVRRNNIEVTASHRFCNAAPVTIAIYYGMQSMFEGETHVLTPGG